MDKILLGYALMMVRKAYRYTTCNVYCFFIFIKVSSLTPMEQQESMFAALCCISGQIKERLFILLNGECPMCPMEPDILITDAIRYNHNARYSFL